MTDTIPTAPAAPITRDAKVDLLRVTGLLAIVLAHVGPPTGLFQLRNFDVPLMVLVAGLSFGLSVVDEPYAGYAWKRLKRLLMPVWIFLTLYFGMMCAFRFPAALPPAGKIAGSYLLQTGIGYVWIIRVFLLVALVAPLLWRWHRATPSHTRFFLRLGMLYAAYELLLWMRPGATSPAGDAFEAVVLYLIPFAVVFAIGLRLPSLTRAQVLRLGTVALGVFAALAIAMSVAAGKFVPTQDFKYPPSLYYLAYALGVSCFLWLGADSLLAAIRRVRLDAPLMFMARNSIWIYLWHIPLVEYLHARYYLEYPFVLVVATLIVYVQVRLVHGLLLPKIASPELRRNLATMLTG